MMEFAQGDDVTLGFVGCGTIAAAMIEGLHLGGAACPTVVSPRGAEIASALASRFPDVEIATDNQAVVDRADVVILSVRPQIIEDVLPALRFREGQRVISLIATLSHGYLAAATAPATVARAVPIPLVARRAGPTAIFPPDPTAKALFDRLGGAIELTDEDQFDIFTAVTGVMAGYFGFTSAISGWMARGGIAPETARAYSDRLFEGLAGTARLAPAIDMPALIDEHQTRGGINEQFLRSLTEAGMLSAVDAALDGLLERLRAGRRKGFTRP